MAYYLLIALVLIYNTNFKEIGADDIKVAEMLPFNILEHENLYLDKSKQYFYMAVKDDELLLTIIDLSCYKNEK